MISAIGEGRCPLRTPSPAAMGELRRRMGACLGLAPVATGATLRLTDRQRPYAPIRHDPDLMRRYGEDARSAGFADGTPAAKRLAFSTWATRPRGRDLTRAPATVEIRRSDGSRSHPGGAYE